LLPATADPSSTSARGALLEPDHRVAEPAPVKAVETAAQETTEEHRDQRLG